MSLDDIPGGSLCVIDTNVLLYAERGASEQSRRLLRRCSQGEITGALPEIVWHELTHRLMLLEATMKHVISPRNQVASLAEKPDIVRGLSLYRSKVRTLFDMGLRFECCTHDDLLDSGFALQSRYGLLTNDSLILAVAIRLDADCLVSSDKAFQTVEEIPVVAPSDLHHQQVL